MANDIGDRSVEGGKLLISFVTLDPPGGEGREWQFGSVVMARQLLQATSYVAHVAIQMRAPLFSPDMCPSEGNGGERQRTEKNGSEEPKQMYVYDDTLFKPGMQDLPRHKTPEGGSDLFGNLRATIAQGKSLKNRT